jgi:hypothetical protein
MDVRGAIRGDEFLTPVQKLRDHVDIDFPHMLSKTVAFNYNLLVNDFTRPNAKPILTSNSKPREDGISTRCTDNKPIIQAVRLV